VIVRRVGLVVALLAILASAFANTGCGTVLGRNGLQDLDVSLNPEDPEAQLRVNGVVIQKGERRVKVDSARESNTIEVTCPDGKIGKGTVTREVNPGIVIADAFMLIFPIYIDYANGGMYRMQRDMTINLGKTFTPDPTPASNPEPAKTTKTNVPTATETKACGTCGEQRPVTAESCPHCGMK
jgi:hypothetical protein